MPILDLAARATSAELAVRAALRGERDEWVVGALTGGIELCTELIHGAAAKPGVVSGFSHPETSAALRLLARTVGGDKRRQRERLQGALAALRRLREAGGEGVESRVLDEHVEFLRDLSRLRVQEAEIERRVAV